MMNSKTSILLLSLFTLAMSATSAFAQQDCQRVSNHARVHGNRTLVIAFEGLASFSASAARAAYQYQTALEKGLSPGAPTGGMSGFVARGLMVPTVQKFKGTFEFVVFPYTATAAAETCALHWMRVSGRRLVIAGHSFGGHAAVKLADSLGQRNVRPETVITIDPRWIMGGIYRSRNAARWENYYQIGGGLPGKSMSDADVNQRLRGGHTGMPFQPEVRAALARALSR